AVDRFAASHFIHAWLLLSAANSGHVSLKYLAAPLVLHRWLSRPFSGADEYLLEPGVMVGVFIDGYRAIARSAFGPDSPEEAHILRVLRSGAGDLRGLRGLLTLLRLKAKTLRA